jgi:uncharacterized membrane protein
LKTVALITGLLIGPYLLVRTLGGHVLRAARLGLALVFGFAAIGHLAKTEAMADMIPPSIPKRRALIWISGVLEATIAASLLVCSKCFWIGLTAMGFLLAVFPFNVYSAIRRVKSGGHATGPRYLLVRTPLQLLLLFWTYWFVLRGDR